MDRGVTASAPTWMGAGFWGERPPVGGGQLRGVKTRGTNLSTGSIDLDDEIDWQRRSWKFQSWGRFAVVLFVIAGALGLFGGGIMGDEKVRDPQNQLEVQHPRFARHDSAYDVRITVQPALIRDGKVAIWIDHELLKDLVVEGVMPEPESVEKSDAGIVLHIRSDAKGPLFIDGYLRTRRFGPGEGRVGVVGGPTVHLKHFIYP
jgi:hypothetical protein